MNPKIKIALYVLLLAGIAWFGYQFAVYYGQVFNEPGTAEVTPSQSKAKPEPDTASTNETKPTEGATNIGGASVATVDTPTNAPAETNTSSETNESSSDGDEAKPKTKKPTGALLASGGAALGLAILLAILISSDVSKYFAAKTEEFLFNDDAKGMAKPEYEEAEKAWANGDHLEAVRLMRDYLQKYPRDQFVALRIAEIYEKDLQNYLAAALEYEEILKKKLPAERWGWAAIHLANLYSGKLNKMEEAIALLRRIDLEYGETAAAAKARQRLARFDGGVGGDDGDDAVS